ncbi:MAG TPA: hypothetical protein ENH94_05705 [Phycisphaerales bacterium]|nr:hypothetical protein [Phycisphaerales bacterium]
MKLANRKYLFIATLSCFFLAAGTCLAVNSETTHHRSSADFLKGETENAIIESTGTISLARKTDTLDLDDMLENVWTINTIVSNGDSDLYLGTSPNGDIIKYSGGTFTKIYPQADATNDLSEPDPDDAGQPFTNEHIFAMAIDNSNQLLAAVSGENCRLLRFDGNGNSHTIFQQNDVSYIFAVTIDPTGSIYLGTGPEGKIYRLDPTGNNPTVIYDSREKNIMSLAIGPDGSLYAGSDQKGIVYKINPDNLRATVLFDSEQTEITSMLADASGNLYVAATSADMPKTSPKSNAISAVGSAGRPETTSKKQTAEKPKDSVTLNIANSAKKGDASKTVDEDQPKRGKPTKDASYIYKMDPQGFVTYIFKEKAVFFSIIEQNEKILLGTGNNAQLFSIDPATEEKSITYQDKQAAQITAMVTVGDDVYLGTSNPPKLIKLESSFADEGTYTSDLIDAQQPSKWGKLQIDAEIPAGCKVMLSAHSGNVKDPNDPTFSTWTEPVNITDPTQLTCPTGRFCQYKLTLKTNDENETPIIRQVSLAHVIPNLPPRVRSVKVAGSESKTNTGRFQISFKADDDNKDKLTYKIDFRKLGRGNWIELKDKLTTSKYSWDTRTVEDSRYEIRITADDSKSNTTATTLTGSRISDPFVVDNTPPVIERSLRKTDDSTVTLELSIRDQFTVIGNLSYTVDSNKDFIATIPDDLIYDTAYEEFTVTIDDLDPGQHVIALKLSDDIGNTKYKTYEVQVAE